MDIESVIPDTSVIFSVDCYVEIIEASLFTFEEFILKKINILN